MHGAALAFLQQFQCDGGAGFSIGEGVVVIEEGVTAGGSHSVELVVGKALAEVPAGGSQGIQEAIAGIVEAVGPKDGFEAAFIEAGVVRHKWVIFQQRMDLLPDLREHRRVLRIFRSQTVHLAAEPLVVFRLRMDETVERIDDDVIADNDHANAAHAARLLVRGLEIQAVV